MTDRTQPARWYMVDKDGMATLCTDREDAEQEAKDANMAWPHTAPHRAVQLVEVGTSAAELHPSPPEGMVGKWMPIETAPVGRSMFVVRAFNVQVTDKSFDYTSDAYGVWQPTPGKFERWPHPFAPTHWMPLPLPPTTSAGSGKG